LSVALVVRAKALEGVLGHRSGFFFGTIIDLSNYLATGKIVASKINAFLHTHRVIPTLCLKTTIATCQTLLL